MPIVIAAVLLTGWYFLNREDVTTPHNPPAVLVEDPRTSNEKELPIRVLSLEEATAKADRAEFSPPKLEDVRVGSKVNFQLPNGPVYEGLVDSIEAKGITTTIVQGNIAEGGFFVFSYGPSAVFGSVTTPEGSFEYLSSGGSEVFRRPPVGKLSNDILESNPERGKESDV
ncbi:hypothetical protein N9I05_04795 [Pseudomonadales bacterium]|nr:hypothetical protein [Pseudomonadales bacterium]